MQVEGEKRLRDEWEKIKEKNVSGGVETIIGRVNTHKKLLNVNIMHESSHCCCVCGVYLGAGLGQRVCVMSLMRSACAGSECQIFISPEECVSVM